MGGSVFSCFLLLLLLLFTFRLCYDENLVDFDLFSFYERRTTIIL